MDSLLAQVSWARWARCKYEQAADPFVILFLYGPGDSESVLFGLMPGLGIGPGPEQPIS